MPRKRIGSRTLLTTAALLAMALLTTTLVGLFLLSRDNVKPLPFDAAIWKSNPAQFSHDSVRLRMVDDFLASYSPRGKTRQQIISWLGEPDDTEAFRSYDMVYQLGQERGAFAAVDSEWLVIRLDSSGVVLEARLVTD